MATKLVLHKYDNLIGSVIMTDDGEFYFEGPQADFLRRWMDDVREREKVSGLAALEEFGRSFSQASFWIEWIEGEVREQLSFDGLSPSGPSSKNG